jgi:hypothetical protein
MNIESFVTLVLAEKYVIVAALVIGVLVRVVKSDTKLPINIPPRYRVWLALALGAFASVLERVATGIDWKQAAVDGAFAALLAVTGHNVIVGSIRNGKDVPLPAAMMDPATTATRSKVPPTMLPPGVGGAFFFVVAFSLILTGCAKFWKAVDIAADKAKCVVAHQELPNEQIFLRCAIEPGDIEKYLDLLTASRISTQRALAKQAAEGAPNPSTPVDAGVPSDDGGIK